MKELKDYSFFSISLKDEVKIISFMKDVKGKRGSSYAGASGGATTYEFTPTSLGLIFKVRYFGEELDLTDYQSW